MTQLAHGIDLDMCDPETKKILEAYIQIYGTRTPTLRQIWATLDFCWDSIGLDNNNPDESMLATFYSNPVWLLNGLFIEQHDESLIYRTAFADWTCSTAPKRVADFGGGYGTLARMIATRCTDASIEVVEPFPRPESIRASTKIKNISFVRNLKDKYDVIIATDVFEHVVDPIGLLYEVGAHVKIGGFILVANHFFPSIKCHLPKTFHLAQTWDIFMILSGFRPVDTVHYGRVYQKVRDAEITGSVRKLESLSETTWQVANRVPGMRRMRAYVSRAISRIISK